MQRWEQRLVSMGFRWVFVVCCGVLPWGHAPPWDPPPTVGIGEMVGYPVGQKRVATEMYILYI